LKYKKFIALGLCILAYVGFTYLLFMVEVVETIESGTQAIPGESGGTSEQVGISHTVTVEITRAVHYENYWRFLPVPTRQGSFDMSISHFCFFNVFVPAMLFISVICEIRPKGKKENIEAVSEQEV